ncbi:MAG: hypothetical protein K2O00_07545 [Muribaculaceae bacterium]|nr:hypothetical protein [Muribaculaceae bacterium]
MMDSRFFTPENITGPADDEILVFGNNRSGDADTPSARLARDKFGAEKGNPAGLQGSSYSIMVEGVTIGELKQQIDNLLELIEEWDQNTFLVTPLGEVKNGFSDSEIAPLFADSLRLYNIRLPESYVKIIES